MEATKFYMSPNYNVHNMYWLDKEAYVEKKPMLLGLIINDVSSKLTSSIVLCLISISFSILVLIPLLVF